MKRVPCLRAGFVTALLLVLSWVGHVNAGSQQTPFEKGTEALRNGNLDTAISEFNTAIDLLETDGTPDLELLSDAYNNRGLAFYRKGDLSNAEQDFTTAIDSDHDPNNEKAYNNLGNIYYDRGELTLARDHYQQALALSEENKPYKADVYNNLGIIYERLNQDSQAMTAYNTAIDLVETLLNNQELDVGFTHAYYNRGNLYYDQGDYDAAKVDYTTTIDLFEGAKSPDVPLLADAYYNRGLCNYQLGHYYSTDPENPGAIQDYQSAIDLRPNFKWAYYSKGFTHFMRGEYNSALTAYQKVLDLAGDPPSHRSVQWAHYGMALVYQNRGQSGDDDRYLDSLTKSCELGNDEACLQLPHD